jgi:hypothetical protein
MIVRCTAAACAVAVTAAVTWSGAVVAADGATVVVDDDGVQCGDWDFHSIGEAVNAASPGDTVRVCPGIYRERVVVGKQLRLIGERDAVETLDCFDETWSSTDAMDVTRFPVIEPPDAEVGSLITLQADGIEVAGLIAQHQRESTADKSTFAPAIQADGAHAGHRIHHNLVQDNTFGIELGSNGAAHSRVDHNCLRENDWGIANQRYAATGVRVDHNDVYRTRVIPFEVGTYAAPISDARFDHNRSIGSAFAAYLVEWAEHTRLDHNTVQGATSNGFLLRGANRDVDIAENELSGSDASAGISLVAPVPQAPTPSRGVVVRGNTAERFTIGILVGINARTSDTRVLANVTRLNRLAGIQIGPTNTEAVVQANISDLNAFGIRTATPEVTGNVFVDNAMHGNTTLDAAESSFTTADDVTILNNTWRKNHCDTYVPADAICVD